ncbi:MAG: phosphotransferase family protein [Dehalococcoidia bacterium]
MTALKEGIENYLDGKLTPDGAVEVSNLYRIPGGASRETWSFDASWHKEGAEHKQGLILRRDPDASLLETERDLEFRVLQAARAHGVPVPEPLWLETDGAALERPFFIMERIDGCESGPGELLVQPQFIAVRPQLGLRFVDVLASIHSLDPKERGLDFIEQPALDGCGEFEVARWEKILDADSLEPQPVLRAGIAWLRNNPPRPAQRISLIHGDFRTGNFLYNAEGEIKAMLDWEMAHLGDPLEDVGWACMRPWRWAGDEQMGALMPREQFYRLYTEATEIEIDDHSIRFWEVLGNLKLAVIFITGAHSFIEGRTRTLQMASLGRNINRLELEILDLMGV